MNCAACGAPLNIAVPGLCHRGFEQLRGHSTPDHVKVEFVTKDSGEREDFETGARRDIQAGKPRFDLIPIEGLTRLAELYTRGAEKYGEHNWQKGIPFRRVYASLFRHLMAFAAGDKEEDHLAAVAWNAMALMAYDEWIKSGKLPETLRDMP